MTFPNQKDHMISVRSWKLWEESCTAHVWPVEAILSLSRAVYLQFQLQCRHAATTAHISSNAAERSKEKKKQHCYKLQLQTERSTVFEKQPAVFVKKALYKHYLCRNLICFHLVHLLPRFLFREIYFIKINNCSHSGNVSCCLQYIYNFSFPLFTFLDQTWMLFSFSATWL